MNSAWRAERACKYLFPQAASRYSPQTFPRLNHPTETHNLEPASSVGKKSQFENLGLRSNETATFRMSFGSNAGFGFGQSNNQSTGTGFGGFGSSNTNTGMSHSLGRSAFRLDRDPIICPTRGLVSECSKTSSNISLVLCRLRHKHDQYWLWKRRRDLIKPFQH